MSFSTAVIQKAIHDCEKPVLHNVTFQLFYKWALKKRGRHEPYSTLPRLVDLKVGILF